MNGKKFVSTEAHLWARQTVVNSGGPNGECVPFHCCLSVKLQSFNTQYLMFVLYQTLSGVGLPVKEWPDALDSLEMSP